MNDFEFIRKFSEISVNKCCKYLKIDPGNVYNQKTTLQNAKKVREEIEDRIARLYLKGKNENVN